MQAFFQSEEGHKYNNTPLFIVGESYGGQNAPAIAHKIWRGNKDLKEGLLSLNLQGLAVGGVPYLYVQIVCAEFCSYKMFCMCISYLSIRVLFVIN
jgi:carboxypeptidase C (cathepsin A)